MVAAMSFAGATPETSSTVDSLVGGLPSFLAQLNLGIVALVVNLVVMVGGERGDARVGRRDGDRRAASSAFRAGRVERFAVSVGEDVLADLHRRLDATRWPDEAPDAGPEHGFGLAAARELAAYWRDGYDWRAAEARLNGFEQHVGRRRALHRRRAIPARRCVLLHGWPSSVWEFVRLAPAAAPSTRG